MTNKNIAVIGLKGLPAFGGAATVGENLIAHLKDDYNFTVYSVSSHTHLKTGSYNGFHQIVFRKFPIKKLNIYYYYLLSVLHCLIFSRYDLIHVHHTDIAIIIPLLNLKYKTIITSHGSVQKIKSIKFKYSRIDIFFLIISERFLKYANIITAVSKNLSNMLSDRYSIQVNYIPNGIDIFNNNQLGESRLVNSKDYILFGAGRIIHTKGCHILLKALNQLGYSGQVIVVGDMTQDAKYSESLYNNSQNLNVSFLGMIKDKQELFSIIKNAKMFIYPSSLEAMSMMLLEVASYKVPIICSDIVENKDIFGINGVQYFETNNYLDLVDKINWAFENYNTFQGMANRSFKKLETEFNWSHISQQYSSLYDKLLAKNKG